MQWLVEWASLIWLTASAVAGSHAPPARVAPVDTAADRATCEAAIGVSAVAACTRAIASDRFAGRELARLYGQRGDELRRIGSLDAALADFDRAIGLDPDDLHAWYKRADTHRDRGEFDFAIADYSDGDRARSAVRVGARAAWAPVRAQATARSRPQRFFGRAGGAAEVPRHLRRSGNRARSPGDDVERSTRRHCRALDRRALLIAAHGNSAT